jgi:hypothetical protein
MSARIEGRPPPATQMCTPEDPDPVDERTGEANVDAEACRQAVTEEIVADVACLGSALWTLGSLPSVLGAIGGATATAAACTYAGLKAADADQACGRARDADPPTLTWSSESS